MKVYVAPWGDPSNWTEVEYIKDGKSTKAFTTLPTYEDYESIFIIVQDSILLPSGLDENKKTYRNTKIEECIEKIKEVVLNPKSYRDWLNNIDEYILCCVQKANIDPSKIRVIKVPSIGKFTGKFRDNNDKIIRITYNFGVLEVKQNENKYVYLPLSYLESLLAYNIYQEIKNLENEKSKKVEEIILDLTHGINYFTSLVLIVVMNLASLLNIKLRVINFIPTEMQKTFTYRKILSLNNSKFDINRMEIRNIKDIKKRTLIYSLKMGTILPILYIYKDSKREIVNYNEKFIDNTEIRKEGDIFLVVTKPIPELSKSDEVWTYLIFDYIYEYAEKIQSYDDYYSIRDISNFVDRLSNLFSETTINIIKNELNTIFSLASNNLKDGEERMYYAIYQNFEKKSPEEMFRDINITKRNFIAHAGFLKEIVKIKRINEKEILIKYYMEDEKYNEILNKIFDY